LKWGIPKSGFNTKPWSYDVDDNCISVREPGLGNRWDFGKARTTAIAQSMANSLQSLGVSRQRWSFDVAPQLGVSRKIAYK